MPPLNRLAPCLLLLAAPLAAQDGPAAAPATAETPIIELSPFVVTPTEDSGYVASDTLAGSRLKTEIGDLASSIQVLTRDFIDDVGANNAGDLFLHTTSTESSGVSGNFSDFSTGETSTNDEFSRTNPQASQRVRGLARADLTRDYFPTIIPSDRFNTDRIEINRGANSILFGLGSPAGIANTSLEQARFIDGTRLRVQLDDMGSKRVELTRNVEVIDDVLAVRLSVLGSGQRYEQEPAFEDDFRVHGALTLRPWRQAQLRAFVEAGDREANRPNVIPPSTTIPSWFESNAVLRDRMRAALAAAGSTLVVPDDYAVTYSHLDWAWRSGNAYLTDTRIPDDIKLGILRDSIIFHDNSALHPRLVDHPNVSRNLVQVYQPGYALPVGAAGGGTAIETRITNFTNPPLQLNPDNRGTSVSGYVYMAPMQPWREDPLLVPESLADLRVFDFTRHMLSGNSAFQNDDWRQFNVAFEQLNHDATLGVEVAYDRQEYFRESFVPFQGYTGVFIDLMEEYMGVPNPNFGRPFVQGRTSKRDLDDERSTLRATGFWRLDPERMFPSSRVAGWLGKHVITAFLNRYDQEANGALLTQYWDTPVVGTSFNTNDVLGSNPRKVNYLVYLGPSVFGLPDPSQVRLEGMGDQQLWNPGQQASVYTYDPVSRTFFTQTVTSSVHPDAITRDTQEVTSSALVWNATLLDRHLIALYGWRRDSAVSEIRDAPRDARNIADPLLIDDPAALISRIDDDIETRTWSAVARVPQRFLPRGVTLSAYVGNSENFSLAATPVDFYGNQLPSASGETLEYGVTTTLLGGRLSARLNWFETDLRDKPSDNLYSKFINQGILKPYAAFLEAEFAGNIPPSVDPNTGATYPGTPNFPVVQRALADLRAIIPATLLEQANLTSVNANGVSNRNDLVNLGDTEDVSARGTELELTFNPSRSWRLALNVAKGETTVTNFSPRMTALVDQVAPILLTGGYAAGLRYFVNATSSPPQYSSDPAPVPGGPTQSNGEWIEANVIAPYRNLKSQEGRVSAEQREWRVNLVTNYDIRAGRFRGWGAGATVRWQDGAVIGYPTRLVDGLLISDIDNPHVAPPEINVDTWIRHRRKLFGKKVDWNLELRVLNVNTDASDLIPVRASTSAQYEVAAWRMGAPRTIRLTSEFRF